MAQTAIGDGPYGWDSILTTAITSFTSQIAWIELVEYQGYNPDDTLKILFIRGKAKGKSVQQVSADMVSLIILYAKGGTAFDTEKFKEKHKQGANDAIKDLMDTYTIYSKIGTHGTGPDVVTVGRVVLCFLEVLGYIYAVGLAKPIVVDNDDNGTKVPLWASFPGGCTLLTDDEWKAMKEHYLNMMVRFTRIITSRSTDTALKNRTDKEIKDQQLIYAEAGRNSAFSQKWLKAKRRHMTILHNTHTAALNVAKASLGLNANPDLPPNV